jgi:hypothetical protein
MAKLGISTGTVPDDGLGDSLLDGAIKINSNFDEIYTYFGDGTNLTFTGESSSQWVTTSAGIHTLSNVGIGTTNPTENLTVFGDARVTGILTVGTASITLDGSSNIITVGSGVTIDGSTGIIEATSLVIEGTTFTGAAVTSITAGSGISVDQSTGNVTITATGGGGGESYWSQTSAGIHTLSNVGIGTTNPTSALTVKENTSLETLSVSGVSAFNNTAIFTTGGTGGIGVSLPNTQRIRCGSLGELSIKSDGTTGGISFNYIDATDGNIYFRNNKTTFRNSESYTERLLAEFDGTTFNSENVKLYYGGNEKFETLGAGVTITGTTFTNYLNVSGISTLSGDVNVGVDTSVGIVLTSPSGTSYRLIVADDGTLSTTTV